MDNDGLYVTALDLIWFCYHWAFEWCRYNAVLCFNQL